MFDDDTIVTVEHTGDSIVHGTELKELTEIETHFFLK